MAGSNDRSRQTTQEFLGQGSLLKCLHSGDVFTAIWGRFFSRYKQPSQDSLHLWAPTWPTRAGERGNSENICPPLQMLRSMSVWRKIGSIPYGKAKIRSDRSWHLLTLSWRTNFVLDQIEACSS